MTATLRKNEAPEGTPVARVSLTKRRNSAGEFVCRAYAADDRRIPSADYFTDDWADAEATATMMVAANN